MQLPAGKTLLLAFLAGAYIAMGGLFSLMAGFGFPGVAEAPGLQRLLSGLVFPLGLILVVFAGAELFTGNNAVLVPGALGRRYGWGVARNWTLVWMGNFAGALSSPILVVLPGVLSSEMWREAACNIAQAKVSLPWSTVFLRGVGANSLVCLAVWLGMSQRRAGTYAGAVFPIMCFVVIGYEHCIANMFFIPLGMLLGAPVSAAELFAGNLVPATLGNIVGGGLFVGGCTGISTEISGRKFLRQQGRGSPARNPGHEPSHTHAVRIH
ncbi:MAG: formate/nitrite transporter family protein [Alistipes finegoldii]